MFTKIKDAFKPKKVRARLETPSRFSWGQAELPVTIKLLNRSAEPRAIHLIVFEIRENDTSDTSDPRRDWSGANTIMYEHPIELALAPGEEQQIDVVIPTSMSSLAEEAGELPAWMKQASKAIDVAQKLQRRSSSFDVRASTHLHGFTTPLRVTSTIGGGLRFSR